MAQKLSITIFVDRTPKNQTFLKTVCKKINKSKRPRKDWASCAILSQSNDTMMMMSCTDLQSVLVAGIAAAGAADDGL